MPGRLARLVLPSTLFVNLLSRLTDSLLRSASSLPIAKETIAKRDVFFADDNALAACFVKNGEITEDFVKELTQHEPLRVVFRDAGFKDDSVKINVEQIFKLMSPHTDIKTI